MKETLISFETAKLAKEKGFLSQGYINAFYDIQNGTLYVNQLVYEDEWSVLAPTQQFLVEWFWLEHEIWISVKLDFNYGQFDYKIQRKNKNGKWYTAKRSNYCGRNKKPSLVLEEGLFEALKLL